MGNRIMIPSSLGTTSRANTRHHFCVRMAEEAPRVTTLPVSDRPLSRDELSGEVRA